MIDLMNAAWLFVRIVAALMLTAFVGFRCRVDVRHALREPFPGWSLSFDAVFYGAYAIALGVMWRALL